jgi:hypothetical protein
MDYSPLKITLTISAYEETTTQDEIDVYGSGVKFFSYWFAKQDGVMGKDTEALFEEFRQNVCKAMAAGTEGTG